MYAKFLKSKASGLAPNTIKTKLAHVKTYLKAAYNESVITPTIRGDVKQVRPHEAYNEPEIMELVRELRRQPLEELEAKQSGQKSPSKGK